MHTSKKNYFTSCEKIYNYDHTHKIFCTQYWEFLISSSNFDGIKKKCIVQQLVGQGLSLLFEINGLGCFLQRVIIITDLVIKGLFKKHPCHYLNDWLTTRFSSA